MQGRRETDFSTALGALSWNSLTVIRRRGASFPMQTSKKARGFSSRSFIVKVLYNGCSVVDAILCWLTTILPGYELTFCV